MKKSILLILALLLIAWTAHAWMGLQMAGPVPAPSGSPTISYDSYTYCTNSGSGCVANVPANETDGDLLVIVLNDDAGAITAPSASFTQIQFADGYSSADLYVGYRVSSSEPASYDFGSSTELSGILILLKKSGGTWNVEDSSINAAGTTSIDIPASTSTGGMLVCGWGCDDATTLIAAPADMTEIYIGTQSSSRVGAWYQAVTSGDYGKTITGDGSSNSAGILAAITLD